jgi:hypothetical protein
MFWSLSQFWLMIRLALRTTREPGVSQMLRYVLTTIAGRFFMGTAHIFDGGDDERGGGEPPEIAPWPQSPGDLRPEVLVLGCVLDGRRIPKTAEPGDQIGRRRA